MAPKKRAAAVSSFAAVQEGPTDLQGLFRWPHRTLECLLQRRDGNDAVRKARLEGLLSNGVLVSSDYSGLSGEHMMFSQMEHVIGQHLDLPVQHVFCHTAVCDIGELQREVLLELSRQQQNSGQGSLCVFGDINDRLDATARSMLDSLTPAPDADPTEAASSYQTMTEWVMSNRAWALRSESPCYAHRQSCSLRPAVSSEDSSQIPLRLHMAGNTCKGWSSAGKKLFHADKSERVLGIWMADRRKAAENGLEDLFVSECTVCFPSKARLCHVASE